MKIREFRLQKGIFIYKMRISFTKVDFYLQNGSLGLQMGLSSCYSPKIYRYNINTFEIFDYVLLIVIQWHIIIEKGEAVSLWLRRVQIYSHVLNQK